MDDFMVLTRTRWHLRRCVRRLNEYFDIGGFSIHPDKTYTGRIQHGFDWLGVSFDATGTTGLSDRATRHHRERCLRLYEQACRRKLDETAIRERVQVYRKRWRTWGQGLLNAVAVPDKSIQIRATFWRQGGNSTSKHGGTMRVPTNTLTCTRAIIACLMLGTTAARAQANYSIAAGCLFDNNYNKGVSYQRAPILLNVSRAGIAFELGVSTHGSKQAYGDTYAAVAAVTEGWGIGERVTVVPPNGQALNDQAPTYYSHWSCDGLPQEVLDSATLRPDSPAPVTPGEHTITLVVTYQNDNDLVVDVNKGTQQTEINYTSGG